MSQENVEIVRRAFAGFSEHGVEGVLPFNSHDVVIYSCASQLQLRRLKQGRHILAVEAIDAARSADPTPATSRFKVARRHHR